jgi:hypothetical protein
MLAEAGVETTIFKAHSVRDVSISTTAYASVPIE